MHDKDDVDTVIFSFLSFQWVTIVWGGYYCDDKLYFFLHWNILQHIKILLAYPRFDNNTPIDCTLWWIGKT